jgi:hypothetical protein
MKKYVRNTDLFSCDRNYVYWCNEALKYSCLTHNIVIKGLGYSVKDQALNGCLLLCMFFADDFCGCFVYSASHHQLNKAVLGAKGFVCGGL